MGVKGETEKGFMAVVVQFAKLNGWLVYHTYDSRKSEAGFPDLVMVRSGVLIFAELKLEGKDTTVDQRHWLKELKSCVVSTEELKVFVWFPSDWPEIQRTLQR
jgi:hypothetical protein